MRLDKLVQQHVNNIDNELDFSAVSTEELYELEDLYKKAGAIWSDNEYLKPNFEKLSKDEQNRIFEIQKKVKVLPVLKKRNI